MNQNWKNKKPEEIEDIMNKVSLRNVTKNDWKFILSIRNQDSVRTTCHDTSKISYLTHMVYMKSLVNNPNAFHWIITFERKDVGYIKIIDLEFGSSIKDGYQGMGIGTKAYSLVFKEAKKLGLTKLTASVKIDRLTPLKFEEKTGWKKIGFDYKNSKLYAYKLERKL